MATKKTKRGFGNIRKLPSGRFQARYVGPDLMTHNAPTTFTSRTLAEGWLTDERRSIERGAWVAPTERRAELVRKASEDRKNTFETYARRYIRTRDLRPKTVDGYTRLLNNRLVPTFGKRPIANINLAEIRAWYESQPKDTKPQNAAAYRLLRSVLNAAEHEEVIERSPARLRGAAAAKPKHTVVPATLEQLESIRAAMPPRLRLAVLLAAWGGLREGEILELRRNDVDAKRGTVSISRTVSKDASQDPDADTCPNCRRIIGPPKTAAGERVVNLPPPFHKDLRAHLLEHAATGEDGLLFPGERQDHMSVRYLMKAYSAARNAAMRPDLTFHGLRHTGLTLAGLENATAAQLKHRAGHSSHAAMAIYQHADQAQDKQLAKSMGETFTAWKKSQT